MVLSQLIFVFLETNPTHSIAHSIEELIVNFDIKHSKICCGSGLYILDVNDSVILECFQCCHSYSCGYLNEQKMFNGKTKENTVWANWLSVNPIHFFFLFVERFMCPLCIVGRRKIGFHQQFGLNALLCVFCTMLFPKKR